MADPWEELAAKYGGGAQDQSAQVDPWASLAEKYALPKQAETKPIKIGKDAFPDVLKQELANAGPGVRNLASFGTALDNAAIGIKQLVSGSELANLLTKGRFANSSDSAGSAEDQARIANNRIIEKSAPVSSIAGTASVAAPLFALGGPSVPAAAAIGSLSGATQPVTGNNPTGSRVLNTTIGGIAGAGGQALANKLLGGITSRLSGIEQKMQEKAAQVAASETASARSAAGNAAQNAYRQLEHLRELGANRALTAEEQLVANSLERELAEKALEKLMPAAALKQSTASAYKESMATEAERAAQYAADKLSGNEVKQQIMARLKRYGPAAAGGIVGNMIFPGLGGSVGGAATGLVLRPALRSMINLSKNPAVQHGLLSPMQDSWLLTRPVLPVSSLLAAEGLIGHE